MKIYAIFRPRHLGPGGVPHLILDPSCERLREGFISGYRFNRKLGSDNTQFIDTLEKDQYSHIHNALQYAAPKTVMPAQRGVHERGVPPVHSYFFLPCFSLCRAYCASRLFDTLSRYTIFPISHHFPFCILPRFFMKAFAENASPMLVIKRICTD